MLYTNSIIPTYLFIAFMTTLVLVMHKKDQVFMTLISLEFMYVILILSFSIQGSMLFTNSALTCLLTFIVSSAGVGLSLLVNSVRSHGSDFYKTFNVI